MDHSNMHNMSPPSSSSSSSTANHTNSDMVVMHMTFFWGKNTDVLFAGWPGTSCGMYALCLIVVFLLAVIAEWLTHSSILQGRGFTSRAAGLAQTAVYTLKKNEIIEKIEEAAKPLGFDVQKKNYKMRLENVKAGRKGNLNVATEIFQVAPSLHMVQVSKSKGDTLEFHKFYKKLSNSLEQVVWTNSEVKKEKGK